MDKRLLCCFYIAVVYSFNLSVYADTKCVCQ